MKPTLISRAKKKKKIKVDLCVYQVQNTVYYFWSDYFILCHTAQLCALGNTAHLFMRCS